MRDEEFFGWLNDCHGDGIGPIERIMFTRDGIERVEDADPKELAIALMHALESEVADLRSRVARLEGEE
ncbi:MAG TPA: hypothetical protein DCY18_05445 [Thauera sp.]|nr:hypothetical protein [Thauera sp.]